MEPIIQRKSAPVWILLIVLLGLGLRLAGLCWGQAYLYFGQGDGVAAYAAAVDYGRGEARAQYIGQPNYNERSKLPGPLWAIFCFLGLRFGGSIEGVIVVIILANTAAIYLTYRLAESTLGPTAALWAALFAATLPSTVYYSVGVYNPEIMPLLGGGLCLALWEVSWPRPRALERGSRHIFWLGLLLLMMPQFHMSGLMLWPAVGLVLGLCPVRLNLAWLLAGLLAGGLLYVPYLRGEMAHGWQNTLGMVSGRGGYSWDALKALTVPLNFLVSWVPQWTRAAAEYRELGRACFGSFALFLAFNLFSAVVAVGLVVGAFQKIRVAMQGFWRSPRQTFARAPGLLFLTIFTLVPLFFALVSGRPFHARYCLVLVPALLALAGGAVTRWLPAQRLGPAFAAALVVMTCGNVWFMAAMYRHQGRRIEQSEVFVPSFRQLEAVYQRLKAQAGADRPVQVEDAAYLRALPHRDDPRQDAALLRRYVAVREKEVSLVSATEEAPVVYALRRADEVSPGERGIGYLGHGIALVAATPSQ